MKVPGGEWSSRDGQSSEDEVCDFLYGLVRAEKPQLAIEIGALVGMSSEAIGSALSRNGSGELWTFERDEVDAATVRRRTAGLPVGVWNCWDYECDREYDGVDFLFVDGENRAEIVGRWLPRMRLGGLVAIHDTLHRDPAARADARGGVESAPWVQTFDIVTPMGLTVCRV